MNKALLARLAVVFFAAQILGILTAQNLLANDISVTIVNEDKESIDNSVYLIGQILVFTAVLLVLVRILKGRKIYYLLKALESLAVFGTGLLVFSILNEMIALVLAVLLVATRIAYPNNVQLRNISSIVSTAGVGALIGVSLGVIPVVVFMVLLAIYDYIAVFKTKHMVEIAKNVTSKNLSFTFALPTKEHQFELGTGDIVIPLTFAVSILAEKKAMFAFPQYFFTPALVIAASFAGLVLTLGYLSKRIGTALPALPPQTILMLVVFLAASFFGF